MLLTIDVGNTNITLGLFQQKKIFATFRITTRNNKTSDEYGSLILDILTARGIPVEGIEDVIISSVVPKIMYSLTSGIIK